MKRIEGATRRFDAEFESCCHEQQKRRAEFGPVLAENTVFKFGPLRSIKDILYPSSCPRQVHPEISEGSLNSPVLRRKAASPQPATTFAASAPPSKDEPPVCRAGTRAEVTTGNWLSRCGNAVKATRGIGRGRVKELILSRNYLGCRSLPCPIHQIGGGPYAETRVGDAVERSAQIHCPRPRSRRLGLYP